MKFPFSARRAAGTLCLLMGVQLGALPQSAAQPPDFDAVEIRDVPGYSGNYVRMSVGLDGRVLLACAQNKVNGILWVLDKEGRSEGFSEGMGNNVAGAAGNAEGVIAMAVPHVVHSVIFYNPECVETARYDDYTQDMENGVVGYGNPGGVWAGKSGRFYGFDVYGKAVRVYSSDGGEEKKISLKTDQLVSALPGMLFADEENKRFVLVAKSGIYEFDMEGNLANFASVVLKGPVTMSETGQLYHYEIQTGELREIDMFGETLSTVTLPLVAEESDVDHPWWWSVAVHGGEVFLRKGHPTELFHRYKLEDGSLIKVVEAVHERAKLGTN